MAKNDLQRLHSLLGHLDENEKSDRLKRHWFRMPSWEPDLSPYPWQATWSNQSSHANELGLVAANQVGKTMTGGANIACHAIGEYPPWYEGRRFYEPVSILCAAQSIKQTRDAMQHDLFGDIDKKKISGHGWIPKKNIGDHSFKSVGDAPGSLDMVKVRHISGGWSTIYFMSYQQGTDAFQAVRRHIAWLDEEPRQTKDERGIYSEVQTRLAKNNGLLYFTRTPLYGRTNIINHFMRRTLGTWYMTVGWNQAPHLSDDAKNRLIAGYPAHERETRTGGIPMSGEGAVFTFDLNCLLCEEDEHRLEDWHKINGIDFGINHPCGTVWLAVNPHDMGEHKRVVVYDVHKERGADAITHSAIIKRHGSDIPVAYPHDGDTREKSTGEQLIKTYRDQDVQALDRSARWEEERGGSQSVDLLIQAIEYRARVGTLKIRKNCMPLFDEMRMLHRVDGKVVAEDDDLFKAFGYGLMDSRHARGPLLDRYRQAYANDDFDLGF